MKEPNRTQGSVRLDAVTTRSKGASAPESLHSLNKTGGGRCNLFWGFALSPGTAAVKYLPSSDKEDEEMKLREIQ